MERRNPSVVRTRDYVVLSDQRRSVGRSIAWSRGDELGAAAVAAGVLKARRGVCANRQTLTRRRAEPGRWRVTSLMDRQTNDEFRQAEKSGLLNDTVKALLALGATILAGYALGSIINGGAGLVGFLNSATGVELGFHAARSYTLMRPSRTGRRSICSRERSAMGWSGRGGCSWRLRWGRRPL